MGISELEKVLAGTEVDESVKALLEKAKAIVDEEKAKAAETAKLAASGYKKVEASGERMTGVVLKWSHDRGFGFVKRDDGKGDIFVHKKSIYPSPGFKNAKAGSKVEFNVQSGEKGDSAVNVTAVGGEPCEGGMEMQGTVNSWLE